MTRKPRYQETGRDSFFGDIAYQRVLQRHQTHFLVALQRLFDWDAKSEELLILYQGRGLTGRPPYPPALIFKMLFLSYLYNVSERAMEELADVNMLIKWFLGLAIDAPAPDHSTLTAFKRRLLHNDNWMVLQQLFDEMIRASKAQGVQFGDLQIMDSVHTQADVNNTKDRDRQDRGGKPRDPDARVVHKGKRRGVQANGKKTSNEIMYRGYKSHVSTNAETGIVTSVTPAWGNSADNKAFVALRDHDRFLDLPTRAYGGDKAYDDTDIYTRLQAEGLDTAITLRQVRTTKKDVNKEQWLELQANPEYQQRSRQRFRVEQAFGTAKKNHGFERCRYLGLKRYRIQSFLTFMVVNAKRMIKLLTGVTLRPQAKGRRAEQVVPALAVTSWAS